MVRVESGDAVKILHVVPSFYPAHVYGGPIQSVFHLCCHLVSNGGDVRVLTTNANGRNALLEVDNKSLIEVAEGVYVRYCHRLRPESTSLALLGALYGYLKWADVVHLTAVYNFPTIPTLVAARAMGKPVVWSPRGALQRWEGSTRLKLKTTWEHICRAVAPPDTILHVTSQEEARESLEKMRGFRSAIVPNAVEIPPYPVRKPRTGTLRLMFLGRLHPKKGIENLLEACKNLRLAPDHAQGAWSLEIVGTGDPAYTRTLYQRIETLGLSGSVKMAGELVGKDKDDAFARADLLMAPSYTENFGMVVAEGLSHCVPVIAGRGMPWKRMEEVGCGLWVDNDPGSLASAIERMSRMPLEEMGQAGRRWMEREYGWDSAARRMLDVYRAALDFRSHSRVTSPAFFQSPDSGEKCEPPTSA